MPVSLLLQQLRWMLALPFTSEKQMPASPIVSPAGSAWPMLGELLALSARVPIGFINVAVGGASSEQWLPDGDFYPALKGALVRLLDDQQVEVSVPVWLAISVGSKQEHPPWGVACDQFIQ